MTRTTVVSFLLGLLTLAPGPGGGRLEADDPLGAPAVPPGGLAMGRPPARVSAGVPEGRVVARIEAHGETRSLRLVATNTSTATRTFTAEVSITSLSGSPMARVAMPVVVFHEKIPIEVAAGATATLVRSLPAEVAAPLGAYLPTGAVLSVVATETVPAAAPAPALHPAAKS